MDSNVGWDAMSDRASMTSLIALGSVCICLLVPGAADADEAIDFSREIRPILAEHCLHCHGPDARQRKADLRLDELASAIADRRGLQAIAPGKPERSALLERVQSDDPDVQMPPADAGQRRLTRGEIDLLRLWIAQGAKWSAHWSFVAPRRPSLPTVRDATWPRNAIDYFILSRLDREGLRPQAPADPVGLLRRVTQDLTGLPPTLEEVENFLADDSPDRYEKVVERLLASPRYGEHMALAWLDAARYADTSGYQADWERFMWPWRDWVVGAYNANLPFDQFTVEQLAGDLLPHASASQVLATGFNRNHRINDEGGSLDAEFEVEYVVDRVDTTSTVWLGLTAGCARCHDHKYDPISQKEYYRLFAFFNNVPEKGIDGRHGAAKPFIEVPNPAVQERIAVLKRQLETRQQALAHLAEGSPEREVATKEIAEVEEAIKKLGPRAVTPVQVMQELPGRRPTWSARARRLRPAGHQRTTDAGIAEQPRRSVERATSGSSGAGALARESREPADRARDGESALATSFRRWLGPDAGRLWQPRRAADASGASRLAGNGAGSTQLGHEGAPSTRRHQCRLSSVVARHTGTI